MTPPLHHPLSPHRDGGLGGFQKVSWQQVPAVNTPVKLAGAVDLVARHHIVIHVFLGISRVKN